MTVSLDAALSGLRVAQQALDTASNNIANASNPPFESDEGIVRPKDAYEAIEEKRHDDQIRA